MVHERGKKAQGQRHFYPYKASPLERKEAGSQWDRAVQDSLRSFPSGGLGGSLNKSIGFVDKFSNKMVVAISSIKGKAIDKVNRSQDRISQAPYSLDFSECINKFTNSSNYLDLNPRLKLSLPIRLFTRFGR